MSTKPPVAVNEAPANTPEKIAYAMVADVPVREPNDANRLGFCLWAWMTDRTGTIEEMVKSSGVRSSMPDAEIARLLKGRVEEFDKRRP
jgi:hypothetical protein